jgi:hypothetical protein
VSHLVSSVGGRRRGSSPGDRWRGVETNIQYLLPRSVYLAVGVGGYNTRILQGLREHQPKMRHASV